LISFQ